MFPVEILSEPTHDNMRLLCLIWVCLFGVLLVRQWTSKRAIGFSLIYGFGMTMIHLPGAFAYCFDYYQPRTAYLLAGGNALRITHAGMWMATVGFACFVVGVLLCPFLFPKDPVVKVRVTHPQLTTKLPTTLFLLSVIFYFVAPFARRIPSVGAVFTGGLQFSVVAVFLFCYQAYREGNVRRFLKWLASTLGFPVVTVLFMGFMSYGVAAATAVWMLVLKFFKPRWIGFAALLMVLYFGASLFVNWMYFRDSIRRSVWRGQTVSQRVDQVGEMMKDLEPFKTSKQMHLEWLDIRLNQNDFVGKAMLYTGRGQPFARGYTLWIAITAWIPRIIWPNKPVVAGSGNLVSHFTGQELSEETSFGVGQVLEFYVNFGTTSVVVGFLIFGVALTFFDQRAAHHLNNGDYWNMTRWMVPAMGLIQPNGALGEVVSAAAANGILVFLFHHYFFGEYYKPSRWTTVSTGDAKPRGSRLAHPRSSPPKS